MKRDVKLSVLMPAYNVAPYIGEAVKSVLQQSFSDFELLVINDGSTDATESVVRSFNDDRIVLLHQPNRGIAAALNTGLRNATAGLVVRFDADDICYPHRLATQYCYMMGHPSCVLAGSAVDYITENGEYVFTHYPAAGSNSEIRQLVKKSCPFIHSSVIYQKKAVLKHGGYNPRAHSFEDHLLWRSLVQEGDVVNLPEPLVKVRFNPASITIDEQWRPRLFHQIKNQVMEENRISEAQGQTLLQIIRGQNKLVLKEGAYHALLAKKFLWNNHQPQKARACLKAVLQSHRFHLESYAFFALSYLPGGLLQRVYKTFKQTPSYALPATTNPHTTRLFVEAHCFDREHQGAQTFLKEIYTLLLKEKNFCVYLAAHNVEKLKAIFPPSDNLVFLRYQGRSALYRWAFEIPRLVRKHRIDLAHFQYITPLVKNCRQLVTIHDVLVYDHPGAFPFLYRQLRRFLFRRSVRTADLLTTVSQDSKQSMQRHLPTGTKKITVLPNGVHERFFEAYHQEQAKHRVKQQFGVERYILFVGRREPRKNQHRLLKAFVELGLAAKGYALVFVGHPSLPVPLFDEAMAALSPGTRQSVFLHEQVSEEALLWLYRAAAVFVYPSTAEGFGIPPLEAAAAGVPVICSNTTAMKAFHFFAPYHIDPHSENDLKQALTRILEEPPSRAQRTRIAETIRQQYSWQPAASRLTRLVTGSEGNPHGRKTKTAMPTGTPVPEGTTMPANHQPVERIFKRT